MAVLTISHAPVSESFIGYVYAATPNLITIKSLDDSVVQNYYGVGFTYDPNTFAVTGGTVTSTDLSDSNNGGLQYTITGLSHDAVTVAGYVNSGDANGLRAYLLNGNDFISGSGDPEILQGYTGNDSILGGGGGDFLDGGGQNDTLKGGAGDDSYTVHGTEGLLQENLNEGTDTVYTITSYTLLANFENLIVLGTAAVNGTGNDANNVITGNGFANLLDGGALGNDTLDGGDGDDTLTGGAGSDSLDGGAAADSLSGGANGDIVFGSIGNDTLDGGTGNDMLDGGGNEDTLAGGAGADTLLGGSGSDTLEGGADADTLQGGVGDDIYIPDALDTISDDGGIDVVRAGFAGYVLGANLENLTLINGAASGTGNSLNNVLTGDGAANLLNGGAGADTLNGGGGIDTLAGGADSDVHLVSTTGVAGAGRITFVQDAVIETAGGGADTVYSSSSYTLSDEVENMVLSGAPLWRPHAGTGNGLDNVIVVQSAGRYRLRGEGGSDSLEGGTAADTLEGGAGNDTLHGAAGVDQLAGGQGNDTYILTDLLDTVDETGGSGADTIQSSVSVTAAAGVEDVVLTGLQDINATGNGLANTIIGNGGINFVSGLGGNDTLTGGTAGAVNDTLAGGAGDDTYDLWNNNILIEAPGEGTDAVFARIATITLADNVDNLTMLGAVALATASGNSIANFITAASATTANLSGLGGNDTLVAGTGADTLNGGTGVDSLVGAAGNDLYVVDAATDAIVEVSGDDTVHSSVTLSLPAQLEHLLLLGAGNINGTGNSLANTLKGNDGANFLDGGAGADTYFGSAGNDTYVLNVAEGDTVLELASGGGVDTVRVAATYTLGGADANVENITLTGLAAINATGNDESNLLTGNDAANYLRALGGLGLGDTLVGAGGNDTLDGSDSLVNATLTGGGGDDLYLANGDLVVESADSGIDTVVLSDVSNYELPVNVENLVGTGTGNALANTITGSGALGGAGGNDTLVGGTLGDTLDGGTGADSMAGGAGADTYVVDDAGDVVVELTGGGFDSILGAMSLSIAALPEVEAIALQESGNFTATGNTADNFLIGNSGNNSIVGGDGHDTLNALDGLDTLDGGNGNDTLTGGLGVDSLAGGAGNDWLAWDSIDGGINGGADFDTLDIGGGGAALDLTLVADGLIQDVEAIDLADSSFFVDNEMLTLAASDVLALSSTTNTLRVDGDAGDVVNAADEGWSFAQNVADGGQTYAEYANGGALLQVDVDITRYLLPRLPLVPLSGLDGTNGFRISGEALGNLSGFAVSSAGDVNGDGFSDLLVGAPYAVSYAGASYIVFGAASGFGANVNVSGLDGTGGLKLSGVNGGPSWSDGDNSGKSVSLAGDVNGDGYGDVMVGAFRADPNGNVSGASYLVFGGTGAYLDGLHGTSGFNLSGLDGVKGVLLNGANAVDLSGRSVSGAGDFNGDGYDDLVIGAYYASGGTGVSYVVFGGSGAYLDGLHDTSGFTLSGVNGSNGFKLSGAAANDFSGFSVAGAGDVNGDGRDDLVVGARGADPNGGFSGASYVVFGATSGFGGNLDLSALTGTNGFKLSGVAASDSSGQSVSGAGDVNGDGYADLIVGAPGASPNGTYSGASYVVFGAASGFSSDIQLSALSGTNGFRISGETAGDRSGISVSGAGDVNGDGYDDLIVGAHGADPNNDYSGAAYVLFGAASGFGANVDLAAPGGVDGFRLAGLVAADNLGRSVSAAGDINGDGFDDVIVGVPGADFNGGGSGASYVVFGSDYNNAVNFLGTAGNDSLSGGAGAEVFVSGLGNDTLTGGGGADAFNAGAGDDRIVLPDLGFRRVDGGAGTDALVVTGGALTLNLTTLSNTKITGIEVVELTGSGNNTLTLAVSDLLDLSDSTNTLRVDGNTNDVVNAGSGWTDGGAAAGYHTWTQGLATLIVDDAITQNIT